MTPFQITTTETILYVSDQHQSKVFYSKLLNITPTLDVPGMTEFTLHANCKLGLMPNSGIAKIITPALPHPADGNGIPRCELYLNVSNVEVAYKNAVNIGAQIISEPAPRDWGDKVAYLADADGHVIAFAEKLS